MGRRCLKLMVYLCLKMAMAVKRLSPKPTAYLCLRLVAVERLYPKPMVHLFLKMVMAVKRLSPKPTAYLCRRLVAVERLYPKQMVHLSRKVVMESLTPKLAGHLYLIHLGQRRYPYPTPHHYLKQVMGRLSQMREMRCSRWMRLIESPSPVREVQ
jgi:hypothetical protein